MHAAMLVPRNLGYIFFLEMYWAIVGLIGDWATSPPLTIWCVFEAVVKKN
jgi:hypothetical protein